MEGRVPLTKVYDKPFDLLPNDTLSIRGGWEDESTLTVDTAFPILLIKPQNTGVLTVERYEFTHIRDAGDPRFRVKIELSGKGNFKSQKEMNEEANFEQKQKQAAFKKRSEASRKTWANRKAREFALKTEVEALKQTDKSKNVHMSEEL